LQVSKRIMEAQTAQKFLEGKGDIFNGLTITELPDSVEEFEQILTGMEARSPQVAR
jgi:hypothetical protein